MGPGPGTGGDGEEASLRDIGDDAKAAAHGAGMPADPWSAAMTAAGNRAARPATGPSVWTGAEMADRRDWTHRLTGAHVEELERAVADVRARGLDLLRVGRADVPLPTLGRELGAVGREVVDGRGFVLIKGVDIAGRDRLDAALAFWTVGLYLGDPVSQNAKATCWATSRTWVTPAAIPTTGVTRPARPWAITRTAATSSASCAWPGPEQGA